MDKYEYLTGEDFGLKPSTAEQAKFEYSPLGKVCNKGLDEEEDKKEGILKRLKNVGGKNEAQLKTIKDQGKKQLEEIKNIIIGLKPLKTISFFRKINEKVKKLKENIKQIDKWLDSAQLICTRTDGKTKYNFSNFTFPIKFASNIYDLTLQQAKDDQQDLEILINKLNNDYNPRNQTKINEKNDDALKSAK